MRDMTFLQQMSALGLVMFAGALVNHFTFGLMDRRRADRAEREARQLRKRLRRAEDRLAVRGRRRMGEATVRIEADTSKFEAELARSHRRADRPEVRRLDSYESEVAP